MKRYLVFCLACLCLIAFESLASSAAIEVPATVFAIGDSTIGVHTFDDVQKVFGVARPTRVGKQDGADVVICYTSNSSKKKTFLVFESGVMGGSARYITGFRLSVVPPTRGCSPTSVEIGPLKSGNGIYLGQSPKNFYGAFPIKFARNAGELFYEGISRRGATADELLRIRTKWPDSKDNYFDVTTTIKARFRNDRLVDYYVRKIESF